MMATVLRDLSYRYQWFYDAMSRLAALSVGGETRFRQLAFQGLEIQPDDRVLDLCCGSGQATRFLVQRSRHVTGLDASPRSLQRAQHNVPQAHYVEAFAEAIPLPDQSFDLVHTSVALHEMESTQLQRILQEVYRVLQPGGYLTLVDFHKPDNPWFGPGLYAFLAVFETETAWQWLNTDLVTLLQAMGFAPVEQILYAGGSLQVIQAQKP
ncbi:MAG: methyltransferase domain-containing protein [Leptolyngbyaceae cyanobacterium bins.349]|nr:methyltransferase domain-containing protein [Leptolyngbyaceae cyanobacterium bins.349]